MTDRRIGTAAFRGAVDGVAIFAVAIPPRVAWTDAVILTFNSAHDIGPFTAEYVVAANEPIDPIRGEIEFAVSWEADSSDS